MKLFIHVFSMLIMGLFPVLLQADINDLESGMEDNPSNYYYNNSNYRYDDGGYKRDVNVIGRQTLLVRQRFTQYDFGSWRYIYNTALAYEYFINLMTVGKLSPQAVVMNSDMMINGKVIPAGHVLSIEEVIQDYQNIPRALWVVDLLKENNVLDAEGYLVGIDAFSDVFNRQEFSKIKENIIQIELNIDDKILERDLQDEIYQYMLTRSQVIEVTQEEVVRYQSEGDNVFEHLVDGVIGNAIGSAVFDDTVRVVKRAPNWTPRISLDRYFGHMFSMGFNNYPFDRGTPGILILKGRHKFNKIDIQSASGQELTNLSVNIDVKRLSKNIHPKKSGSFYGFDGGYSAFNDTNNESLQFVEANVMGGMASQRSLFQGGIGLAYRNTSSEVGSVGLSLGLKFKYFLLDPLAFEYTLKSFSQPNSIEDKENWSIGHQKLGLALNYKSSELTFGYKWVYNNNKQLSSGAYIGLGMYF